MNERRDDWAQAFGESVGIVALASACLALPIGRRRSASLSPRRHPWDNVPFGLPDGFDFGRQGLVSRVLTTPTGSSGNHLLCS
jgi:hypothetical protein